VASVTFAEVLPWLFVSLPSGAIVDRYDRRRLMQLSAVGRVVLLALLLALMPLHLLSIPVLVGLGLLLGSTDTFGGNAAVGLVRGLVRPAQLEQANSVVGGIDAVLATLVGPTLGAVLFSVATGAPFGLDALGFLLAALLLQGVRGDFRPRREAPATLLQEMRSGISWLWHHQMLRTLTVLFATNNLAFGMIFGILVLYALEVLHLPQAA
jgi:MFS family permease